MKAKWLIVLFLLFPSRTTWADNFLLTKGHVGDLAIGAEEDQVSKVFSKALIKKVDLQLEDEVYPALDVYLDKSSKKPSIQIRLNSGLVWGFTVYDPKFKTTSGIGPGSTLGQVRKVYTNYYIGGGEGSVFAVVQDIDMSFALYLDQDLARKFYTSAPSNNAKDNPVLPDSVKIDLVYMH